MDRVRMPRKENDMKVLKIHLRGCKNAKIAVEATCGVSLEHNKVAQWSMCLGSNPVGHGHMELCQIGSVEQSMAALEIVDARPTMAYW